jgi:predicted transcriptional regulator
MAEVRDLMSRDVVTVSPDLSLRDTVGLLDDRHITGAPVVSNGQVVGVISVSDLMSFEAATPGIPRDRPRQWWQDAGADLVERFQEVSSPEWDVLVEHTVSEAMNRSVCSIGPDADAAEAAAYMLRAGVHRLLVTDESELVGIITTTDIVRAVAEQRL